MGLHGMVHEERLATHALPWEIETLFLLCIVSKEWKYDEFKEDGIRKLQELISSIRDYKCTNVELKLPESDFARYLFVLLAASQFEQQEEVSFKIYRYSYIFGYKNADLDMPSIFLDKYGCTYDDFACFAYIMWFLFQPNKEFSDSDLYSIIIKFPQVIHNLCVTREEYKDELSVITSDVDDYYFCFRPSCKYPFISHGATIQIPLPHLVIRACTSALYFRLTDNDLTLKSKIGKHVLEDYLFSILDKSCCFEEINHEVLFKYHGSDCLSPDVLARSGNDFFFFESKSMTPKIDIRTSNVASLNKNIDDLVAGCLQLYTQLTERFPRYYNPFSVKHVSIENVWGVLVVFEDSYVERIQVYIKVAEKLGIEKESAQYKWLTTHIGIASLYNLEKYCFISEDIPSAIKANASSGNIYDYWFVGASKNNVITNQELLEQRNACYKRIQYLLRSCYSNIEGLQGFQNLI